jgi:hypothetical protein
MSCKVGCLDTLYPPRDMKKEGFTRHLIRLLNEGQ